MNILYLTLAQNDVHPIQLADYLSDLLFHGLRELYGHTVVEIPEKLHMYKPFPQKDKLWGRGFSFSETLDKIDVDRTDILKKIENSFFDLIVLSVHHTIHTQPRPLLDMIQMIRTKNLNQKIAVVDGHDTQSTYEFALDYTPYLFKREIPDGREDLIPIHFCIPTSKIVKETPVKTKFVADIVPANHDSPNRVTHTYTKELDYYDDYRSSYFGLTCIKGGADCLRHAEVMAQAAIPIFCDIERVPNLTLTNLPKKLLSDIKDWPFLTLPQKTFGKNDIQLGWKYVDENKFDKQLCDDTIEYLLKYTREKLTTLSLAKYFLEKCNAY